MNTVAIVGAGSGLGAAVARRFAREGFSVALIARNQDRLDALAADLASEGFTARGYSADVRMPPHQRMRWKCRQPRRWVWRFRR